MSAQQERSEMVNRMTDMVRVSFLPIVTSAPHGWVMTLGEKSQVKVDSLAQIFLNSGRLCSILNSNSDKQKTDLATLSQRLSTLARRLGVWRKGSEISVTVDSSEKKLSVLNALGELLVNYGLDLDQIKNIYSALGKDQVNVALSALQLRDQVEVVRNELCSLLSPKAAEFFAEEINRTQAQGVKLVVFLNRWAPDADKRAIIINIIDDLLSACRGLDRNTTDGYATIEINLTAKLFELRKLGWSDDRIVELFQILGFNK